MIQIDMEMPKFCWWMDGDDYRKCPMVDGKNGCCLHSNVCYATWEEQYKHCPLHEVTDSDTISRRQAIDALMEILDRPKHAEFLYTDEICKTLNGLPSTQPEIIRCEDCKHWSRESICDGFCSEDCMRHDEEFYCGYAEERMMNVYE